MCISCKREFCLRATSHRWGHCTLLDSRFCPHSFSPEIPTRRDTRDPRCPFWTKSDLFHRMLSDCRYIFASVPAPLPRGDTPTFPAKFARPGRARPSLAFLSQHLRGTAFLSSDSPVCDFHALSPTIHVSDHGGYTVPPGRPVVCATRWACAHLSIQPGFCLPNFPALKKSETPSRGSCFPGVGAVPSASCCSQGPRFCSLAAAAWKLQTSC